MKKTLLLAGLVLLGLIAYLLFWPVPISPQKWDAPLDQGFTGKFEVNDRLAGLERLTLGEFHGPEDIVLAIEDGHEIVYTSSQDGVIIRVDTVANTSSVFAETGGVPLGMERDAQGNFIVADAYRGLLSISPAGEVTTLTDTFDGQPIVYADDLDIAQSGIIYFSDASTKFGAEAAGSTLAASLLEISEHGKTGRFLSFDPATGETALVADGFNFSNGVAMCPDDACILVAETGTYSIHKIYVAGPRQGETETLIDNLPGFPDNINRGGVVDGKQTYWVGLAAPRSPALDAAANRPFLRALSFRLPEAFRISAGGYGCIFQIDEDGNILQTLQDPEAAYPITTGAVEGEGWLYVTSLESPDLGRLPYP